MFSEAELNRFYRYCIALTGDEEDAFDLLQDSLEKLITRGPGGLENIQGYFFKMIRNRFIDEARSRESRQAAITGGEAEVIEVGYQSLENIVMDREETDNIMALLDFPDRELLFLWAVAGFTVQEIAEHSGIPKGTLLSRIHRLRHKILKTLETGDRRVNRR
jgi:RNA polymerase sigma-70 factor (ECF subfamily)